MDVHDSVSFIQILPDGIESGICEGDAVIGCCYREAVGWDGETFIFFCGAGDFFQAELWRVGWEGGEETESRRVLGDYGGAVGVCGEEIGVGGGDIREHLHAYV